MTLSAHVRKRGLLTMQDAASLVAGEAIKGSWWSHPAGKRIFAALTALDDDPDVIASKLIDGKVTFVHRGLWPALARAQRERSLWPRVPAEADKLLARVRREGRLIAGDAKLRKARLALERALLVLGIEEHGESGAHQIVLVPFERWLPADVAKQADALSLEDALAALATAGFVLGSRA